MTEPLRCLLTAGPKTQEVEEEGSKVERWQRAASAPLLVMSFVHDPFEEPLRPLNGSHSLGRVNTRGRD